MIVCEQLRAVFWFVKITHISSISFPPLSCCHISVPQKCDYIKNLSPLMAYLSQEKSLLIYGLKVVEMS